MPDSRCIPNIHSIKNPSNMPSSIQRTVPSLHSTQDLPAIAASPFSHRPRDPAPSSFPRRPVVREHNFENRIQQLL